ncbi:MAG TPA: peptidase M48 [Flavobacteriaceae bacterium]|nr:peptidase M48 [Flavobacteriaceae bacterium]MAY52496.1 peptidase M48 [Flavobacteriaceae bacterium]HBR52694.1 peptidase M48 [Flavobacteriaceae bacterium]
MSPQTLFYIIIGILVVSFIIDKWLDALNARHFNDPLPQEINDVYDADAYEKSQRYKKEKYRFGVITAMISFVATLIFLFLDGFALVDAWARMFTDQPIFVALIFFGILLFASDLLSTPFSYYHTFVIEEKYGFNKTNTSTFLLDKVKGWAMMAIVGGSLLALIIWLYNTTGTYFWLYAWGVITIFTVFMNLFYARLIVPIFNKQIPLEEGSLRTKIEAYAKKVDFSLSHIFVIDGSKRSTKANAYFSGFGSEKRVTLYDTLINDLEEDEIVAVLAHEVGHYKKNHILYNLLVSILLTGFTLWIFSLCIESEVLSQALGVPNASFHIGLVAFALLYSPISEITGLFMNKLSRKFEYQADNFASKTYNGGSLINALKKLSKNSLSNLTPHPTYVFVHYSHPTLLNRFRNLKQA